MQSAIRREAHIGTESPRGVPREDLGCNSILGLRRCSLTDYDIVRQRVERKSADNVLSNQSLPIALPRHFHAVSVCCGSYIPQRPP